MTTETNADIQPFDLRVFVSNLVAGLVIGFTEVIFSISLANLIFSGPLAAYLSRGIAITLVTSAISILLVALFASLPGVISGIQDNPTVLLAVAVASLAATLGGGPQLLPTLIAFIFATALVSGLFLLALGAFRVGGLMRYIPYPVIGGFLAGTGWLLLHGAVGSMADYPLSLQTLPALLQPDQLILWLPGVLFGVILFLGVKYVDHFLIMPAILLGGQITFLLLLALSGLSLEQAAERGLALGQIGAAVWQPLPLGDLAQADWGAVLGSVGSIAAIVLLSAVNLLLNVSGMELATHRDVDLNRELRVAGAASLFSALAGGVVGFQDLSYTMLNYRIGGRGRLAGVIAALICLLMLVAGLALFAIIPRALLGGLLLFLGLGFLDEWIVQGWKKLGRADYVVVLLMVVVIALTNFLVGVSLGLLLMVISFALNYSRTNIFHHVLSGAEIVSNVERNAHHRRELAKMARQIYVLELQGFIFFGTANAILEQARQRIDDAAEGPLRYLILDFRRVIGLDSSAMYSLDKLKHQAEALGIKLILCDLKPDMESELRRSGLQPGDSVLFFRDLDHGLEWCEDELLQQNRVTARHVPNNLTLQLSYLGFKSGYTYRLLPYLVQTHLAAGEALIRQGEPFSDLFFIESGQVSVYFQLDKHKQVRVQKPSTGTVVGELGFYLDLPRTALVVAERDTVAYRLTRTAMETMKANDPDLALAFNELMLKVISERLATTDSGMMALSR